MPRDFNHVIITGEVLTMPSLVNLKNNKKLCLFTLLNIERYKLGNGEPASHENPIVIEIMGMKAESYVHSIRKGDRYVISGYLRVDDIEGVERTRVRAFNVQQD